MAQKKNTTSAAAVTSQDMAQALQAAVEAAAAAPAETDPEAPAPEPGVKPADDAADKTAAAPAPSNPEASDASGKTPAGKPAAPSKGPRSAAKTPATARESAAQRVAREVFRSYPDRKTVHVASDGTAFFNRSDAVNYGRTLKDTAVVEVTNQNLKA